MNFSHTNNSGKAQMVDISEKNITKRTAKAAAKVFMKKETLDLIKDNSLKKGDVLSCARIAGIMGGKKTSELIPLCHNLPIDSIAIDFELDFNHCCVNITSTAVCTYKTGIEMEALTSASVAALVIYDMCKAVDKEMVIADVKLIYKTGGKSDYMYNKI